MSESILKVDDLHVTFPTEGGDVRAVRGINFDLAPQEILGIVGESGSGKSVTSLALIGLLPKSARISGSVQLDGYEMVGAAEKDIYKLRGAEIAMIFQDPLSALNPVQRIVTQITEMLQSHQHISKAAAFDRTVDLLPVVRNHAYHPDFRGSFSLKSVVPALLPHLAYDDLEVAAAAPGIGSSTSGCRVPASRSSRNLRPMSGNMA